MYRGRNDLPEAWRMPASWEFDTTEVTVNELDGVLLVLTRHLASLLPNLQSTIFLCVQVSTMHLFLLFDRIVICVTADLGAQDAYRSAPKPKQG
jgi:hypothetical protein